MKRALIVSGGRIHKDFAGYICKTRSFDRIIGADRGLLFLYESGICPDLIVGDFDSLPEGILNEYEGKNIPVRKFNPEKDETDTQLALCAALEDGCEDITILGGTGTRIDHVLGNIQMMSQALLGGATCRLLDEYNEIMLITDELHIKREEQYGDYVSLFPLTTKVTGLTLTGMKYPLQEAVLTSDNSLGVSNEIIDEEAVIRLKDGILIVIQSKDKGF